MGGSRFRAAMALLLLASAMCTAPGAVAVEAPIRVVPPAGMGQTAPTQTLAPGSWRVDWCGNCVGALAAAQDGAWFSTIDSLVHIDRDSGTAVRLLVPENMAEPGVWFPFNPVVVAESDTVWGYLDGPDDARTIARFDGTWRRFTPADGLPPARPGTRMAIDVTGGVG